MDFYISSIILNTNMECEMSCDICAANLTDRDCYEYEPFDLTVCESCIEALLTAAVDHDDEDELCEMMEDITTSG